MSDISDYIKNIEAATSGADIRTQIVNALNYLNNNVKAAETGTSAISTDTIKSICVRSS